MKSILCTLLSLLLLCEVTSRAQPPRRFGGERGGFSREGGDFRGPGGTPSGGGPGGWLDSNRDGRIDADEMRRMPEGLRNAMEARGVRIRPGLSVEEFGQSMRSQFERAREEEERRYRESEQSGDQRPPESVTNRAKYQPSTPFRPREKERMTIDLPSEYRDLDTDFDGQVGLYEWLVARRDDLLLFDEIDGDLDGLLTPKELQFYNSVTKSGEPQVVSFAEKYKRPRVVIVGGSGVRTIRRGGKSFLSDEDREKQTNFASKMAFPYVDVNKDGKISMEELQRDEKTKRIIPLFEKAGIRVEPMTREQFTERWIEAQEFYAEQKANGKEKPDKR